VPVVVPVAVSVLSEVSSEQFIFPKKPVITQNNNIIKNLLIITLIIFNLMKKNPSNLQYFSIYATEYKNTRKKVKNVLKIEFNAGVVTLRQYTGADLYPPTF
jgi:hypothetical protein